jgi:hypothetical protein
MKRVIHSLLIGLWLAGAAEVFLDLSLRFDWSLFYNIAVSPGFFLRFALFPAHSPRELIIPYTIGWLVQQFLVDVICYGLIAFIVLQWRGRRPLRLP